MFSSVDMTYFHQLGVSLWRKLEMLDTDLCCLRSWQNPPPPYWGLRLGGDWEIDVGAVVEMGCDRDPFAHKFQPSGVPFLQFDQHKTTFTRAHVEHGY